MTYEKRLRRLEGSVEKLWDEIAELVRRVRVLETRRRT